MGTCRKKYIDYLKCFSLFLLILAHVNPPNWLQFIRGFDVPLMIFLSGILYVDSNQNTRALKYFVKRIERLLIPTWLFLIGFYICMAVFNKLPPWITILKSFLLMRDSGIAGYVWIVLIYLWCALLSPLIKKLSNHRYYFLILVISVVTYELTASFEQLVNNRMLYYTFFSAIPYSLFMSLGIAYNTMNNRTKGFVALVGAVIFVACLLVSKYLNGDNKFYYDYKYPARLYFFSYSIPIIFALIMLFEKLEYRLKRKRIVEFISKHSFWIYLWHIFFLAVVKYVLVIDAWALSYMVVVLLSIASTWVQNMICALIARKHNYYILKYFTC